VLSVMLGALLHEAIAAGCSSSCSLLLGELSWQEPAAGSPSRCRSRSALTLGLGLLLGAVHVFFRDTSQILGMLLTGWFYLTPIVYPLALVPEPSPVGGVANPLTALVLIYRRRSSARRRRWCAGTAALIGAAACSSPIGMLLFRRLKPAPSSTRSSSRRRRCEPLRWGEGEGTSLSPAGERDRG
jgi:lipopolysaccharide transport system permease protein